MSILGSQWLEEPTNEEKYKDITGEETSDVRKDIEKKLTDSYTSRTERSRLSDLMQNIDTTENK